jgi:hypothetical protein
MTPQFLRYEAARFRGMAGVAERESSKLRLLAMADDYDARASVADAVTEQNSGKSDALLSGPKSDEAAQRSNEPDQGEALTIKPKGRIAREPKEAILVERRPIGRQR